MKRAAVKFFAIIIFSQILSASSRHESGQIVFNDFPEKSLHNIKSIILPDSTKAYSLMDLSYTGDKDHLLTDVVLSFDKPGYSYIRDDSGKYEISSSNYIFSQDSGGIGKGCASFFMKDHGVKIKTVNSLWMGSCEDLGSFNIEFRFKAGNTGRGILFSRVGYSSGRKKGVEIILRKNRVIVEMHNMFQKPDGSWESAVMSGRSSVAAGKWYHFSLSYDRISGKLSRLINGVEDESVYMTAGGDPFEYVYIPSFGHRETTEDAFKCIDLPLAVLGSDYNGFIDEFRISYTSFEDLEKIKDIAVSSFKGSSYAGRIPYNREGVITSPVYTFPSTGTAVTELLWQAQIPDETFIWMEFRLADRFFDGRDPDLKWYRVDNRQRRIFLMKSDDGEYLRGKYFQWRAHLVASPDGRKSPLLKNVKIDYRLDKAPDVPMFLETVRTGDRTVALKWKKNVDHDIMGYRIYYGTAKGKYDGIISRVNGEKITNNMSNNNYIEIKIDNNLVDENKKSDSRGVLLYPSLENTVLYYFSVSAYDSYRPDTVYNHESELSEPVTARPFAGSEIN